MYDVFTSCTVHFSYSLRVDIDGMNALHYVIPEYSKIEWAELQEFRFSNESLTMSKSIVCTRVSMRLLPRGFVHLFIRLRGCGSHWTYWSVAQ